MTIDEFELALANKVANFVKNIVGISNMDFELEEDFCWYPDDDTIDIAVVFAETSENVFSNYCISLGLDRDLFDSFGVSLLHELGHVKTYYTFSKEQIKEYEKNINILETAEIDDCTRYLTYYKLPVETAATKWAIDFIQKHQKEYVTFCLDIQDFCRNAIPQIV